MRKLKHGTDHITNTAHYRLARSRPHCRSQESWTPCRHVGAPGWCLAGEQAGTRAAAGRPSRFLCKTPRHRVTAWRIHSSARRSRGKRFLGSVVMTIAILRCVLKFTTILHICFYLNKMFNHKTYLWCSFQTHDYFQNKQ